MNKNGISKLVTLECNISQVEVIAVMDALEKTIKKLLIDGDQVHWGGFLRARLTERRPTQQTGMYKIKDTRSRKIRYAYPYCEFGANFVNPLKRATYNRAEHDWEETRKKLLTEAISAPVGKKAAGEQKEA